MKEIIVIYTVCFLSTSYYSANPSKENIRKKNKPVEQHCTSPVIFLGSHNFLDTIYIDIYSYNTSQIIALKDAGEPGKKKVISEKMHAIYKKDQRIILYNSKPPVFHTLTLSTTSDNYKSNSKVVLVCTT